MNVIRSRTAVGDNAAMDFTPLFELARSDTLKAQLMAVPMPAFKLQIS